MSLFPVFPIEDQIVSIVQANSNSFLDFFFKIITFFGHPAFWLFIAALLYWNKQERKSFFLVNTIVFASALAAALKIIIARPRPSEIIHRVFPQDSISASLEAGAPEFGFPSGHATTGTAALAFLSKNKKPIAILAFAIIALLVALSRIYLGVHFPFDVIAGLLLGLFIGIATLWIDKAFENHLFHLTKLEDEIIVIALIAIGIVIIAFLDVPVLAASVLGYYAGFFLSKELGFEQSKFSGKKLALKICIGTAGIIILTGLTIALFEHNKPLALFFFFTNGFWISWGFPEFFEKAMRYLPMMPALEKALK